MVLVLAGGGSGGKRRARARRRGPGRGPGRAGMARALARAVGEEKLRFGSVSLNPGQGGKKNFCFWFWRRDNFFFRVEASRRQWMGCGCFVVFGLRGFFGSKKKAIDRSIEFGSA